MIYVDEPAVSRLEVEQLLMATRRGTLESIALYGHPERISGNEFEEIVYENAKGCARGTSLDDRIIHTADRDFPDIVAADFYGIEVKATKKNDWTSIGNSVLESSRVATVEKIYMFFGKLGGQPDIRFRDYESCLKGISVTHYPRYQIDMNLPDGESIFTKIGIPYDELRMMENPIKPIRQYYRAQMAASDSLWWIDDETDNMPALSPVIRNLSSLSSSEKDLVVASVMAFFPEVFSSSSKKYERIPAFLASQYGVVTANLRDFFTAGGQAVVEYDNEHIQVPQIISRVRALAPKIHACLAGKNQVMLQNYWGHKIENFTGPDVAWCTEADRLYSDSYHPHLISEQYLAGLSDVQYNEGASSRVK